MALAIVIFSAKHGRIALYRVIFSPQGDINQDIVNRLCKQKFTQSDFFLINRVYFSASIVLGLELEVSLRMVAHGAHLGSLFAHHDVAAVAALPDALVVAREHHFVLDVFEQLAVAFLVMALYLGYALKLNGNLFKALFAGLTGHAGIHVGPLEVFATSGGRKVLRRGFDATALEQFEPHFGVLLLVVGSLFKDGSNLLITILFSL